MLSISPATANVHAMSKIRGHPLYFKDQWSSLLALCLNDQMSCSPFPSANANVPLLLSATADVYASTLNAQGWLTEMALAFSSHPLGQRVVVEFHLPDQALHDVPKHGSPTRLRPRFQVAHPRSVPMSHEPAPVVREIRWQGFAAAS